MVYVIIGYEVQMAIEIVIMIYILCTPLLNNRDNVPITNNCFVIVMVILDVDCFISICHLH